MTPTADELMEEAMRLSKEIEELKLTNDNFRKSYEKMTTRTFIIRKPRYISGKTK